MKKLASIIFIALALLSGRVANAQVDPHFSEYYIYPSWLNPALTGAIDGDYRISGIYRSQWSSISNGFSTAGLSGELNTNKDISLGGSLLQQKAGNGGYTYTTGYLSVAYTGIRFGANGYHRIAFGIQAGVVDRRFNSSKFQLGDQWNPITGYNPVVNQTAEVFSKTSSTVFDAGAGVVYYDANPDKKANIFGGFSVSHLTKPEDPFTSGITKQTLPMRFTLHGGVKLNLSEVVSVTPNLLYLRQGNAEEKMAGAYMQLKANSMFDLLLGANYRFDDAIAPFVGFYYENLTLGLSYDINNSTLGKTATNANSFEISLSYTGKKSKNFTGEHFICPRL